MASVMRTIRVSLGVSYLICLGMALLMLPALLLEVVLGTKTATFLVYTRTGEFLMVGAGVLMVSFAIQNGEFSQYLKPYRRHEERAWFAWLWSKIFQTKR
jgi:hypothetical protein